MDTRQIIMNYTVAPSVDDLQALANSIFDDIPEELVGFCKDLQVVVEDFVDEATEIELDLDDPYDLLAIYRNGKEISPGVEKKSSETADMLVIYRRSVLDMWCDAGEDLTKLIRQVMIEEIGRQYGFSDEEVAEMAGRHYQGMF